MEVNWKRALEICFNDVRVMVFDFWWWRAGGRFKDSSYIHAFTVVSLPKYLILQRLQRNTRIHCEEPRGCQGHLRKSGDERGNSWELLGISRRIGDFLWVRRISKQPKLGCYTSCWLCNTFRPLKLDSLQPLSGSCDRALQLWSMSNAYWLELRTYYFSDRRVTCGDRLYANSTE